MDRNTDQINSLLSIGAIPEDINRLVMLCYRGSISHGTYTPSYGKEAGHDDVDLFGVCFGPYSSYVGLDKFEQIERMVDGNFLCPLISSCERETTIDSVVYEFRKFVRLAMQGNPNVIMMLWMPDEMILHATDNWDYLVENRDMFIGKHVFSRFLGYAYGQREKMLKGGVGNLGAKRKALVEKFGYSTKEAAHCIRLLRMSNEFAKTGEFNIVRSDAKELIAIKNGEWPLDAVIAEMDRLFAENKILVDNACMPDSADEEGIKRIVEECVHSWICTPY